MCYRGVHTTLGCSSDILAEAGIISQKVSPKSCPRDSEDECSWMHLASSPPPSQYNYLANAPAIYTPGPKECSEECFWPPAQTAQKGAPKSDFRAFCSGVSRILVLPHSNSLGFGGCRSRQNDKKNKQIRFERDALSQNWISSQPSHQVPSGSCGCGCANWVEEHCVCNTRWASFGPDFSYVFFLGSSSSSSSSSFAYRPLPPYVEARIRSYMSFLSCSLVSCTVSVLEIAVNSAAWSVLFLCHMVKSAFSTTDLTENPPRRRPLLEPVKDQRP